MKLPKNEPVPKDGYWALDPSLSVTRHAEVMHELLKAVACRVRTLSCSDAVLVDEYGAARVMNGHGLE